MIYRYIAVCHPYRHREYNYRFNVVNRILIYTLPVFFFSLVLNIPKFYETKVEILHMVYFTGDKLIKHIYFYLLQNHSFFLSILLGRLQWRRWNDIRCNRSTTDTWVYLLVYDKLRLSPNFNIGNRTISNSGNTKRNAL